MADKFSINASISISPDNVRQDIEEVFVRAYGGIGDDETPAEFVARKCEEFILNTYSTHKANFEADALRAQIITEVKEVAAIKQRKDKPAEEENLK